jgi:hypothetical protein
LKIATLLLEELKNKGLTERDLSSYGQLKRKPIYRIVRQRGSDKEVEAIMTFYQLRIRGQTFEDAIENARRYLEVIEDVYVDKGLVDSTKEEIMPHEELSQNPLLTKEELDNYEGHNEYDSYYEKIEKEILQQTFLNRREEIERKIENFKRVVEPLKGKISQRREKKRELLQELEV